MQNIVEEIERGRRASEGVEYLKDGYIAYAEEVISERAIPNIYDGLKPVHRKIMWTLYSDIKKDMFTKSQTVAGDTMAYHPHAADAIYKAAVLMTDSHEFTQFPLIEGSGSYGNCASGELAASMRYTEMRIHHNAKELFNEIDGVDKIPNFDSTRTEPVVLPVSFPYVLCNPSEGIAVGFASKIPSFNLNDVIDLTIEYLENGKCTSVIAPDFMTGGYYVKNDKELKKLMQVGKASLKLRAKWEIHNEKEIVVTEVPFGKNVTALCEVIDDKNIDGIVNVSNFSDYNGINLTIVCRSKSKVDDVIHSLLKDTDIQYNFNANLTIIQDGVPRQLGVYRIIEEWCKWRKDIVKRDTEMKIKSCKAKIRESATFMALISDKTKKDTLVQIVATQGRQAGMEYVKANFTREQIPEDLIKFVCTRTLDTYNTGGKYADDYATMTALLSGYEEDLRDLNKALIRQLQRVKAEYGGKLPRRTEITTQDYDLSQIEEARKEEQVTNCVFSLKDNFLKKSRVSFKPEENEQLVKCLSNDKLIMFDSKGRLLRAYAKDFEYTNDLGVYLPKYFDLEEEEDYKVKWIGRVDGEKKIILYNDGNIGFLDTSEFLESKRQAKITTRGINSAGDKVCAVLYEKPEILLVVDDKGYVSWTHMSGIMEKSRTARTKAFNVKKGHKIVAYVGCTIAQLTMILENIDRYKAPYMRPLKNEDDYHDGIVQMYGANL